MKAALYQGKGNIELTQLEDPVCEDDGIILQNIYASICGTDVDIYIDAAGADDILDFYQENGKVDSRMVLVAVGTNVRSVDVLGMTFGQLAIIGSGGYNPEDVIDVMKIMESSQWDIEKMITHEYPWKELETAIQMSGNAEEALNVVIHY